MTTQRIAAALAGLLMMGVAVPAVAAAPEAGTWQVRARAIGVLPDVDSSLTPALTANVDDSWMPELDFTYFFTPNVSAELILATTEHDVSASGIDLGSTWVLPPTLTLQYHFNTDGQFQPYVGAGVNYTIFYGGDDVAGLGVDYENSFGFALQGGVDIFTDEHWFLNLDVKKIWLSTDVSVGGGAVTGEVDLDPWVVGVGFGYRF